MPSGNVMARERQVSDCNTHRPPTKTQARRRDTSDMVRAEAHRLTRTSPTSDKTRRQAPSRRQASAIAPSVAVAENRRYSGAP